MGKRRVVRISRNFADESNQNAEEDRRMTPEERLNLVEYLRIEAGKSIYEYPARFRRVFTVTRKK